MAASTTLMLTMTILVMVMVLLVCMGMRLMDGRSIPCWEEPAGTGFKLITKGRFYYCPVCRRLSLTEVYALSIHLFFLRAQTGAGSPLPAAGREIRGCRTLVPMPSPPC